MLECKTDLALNLVWFLLHDKKFGKSPMSTQLIQQERQLKVLSLMGLDTAQFEITQASAI